MPPACCMLRMNSCTASAKARGMSILAGCGRLCPGKPARQSRDGYIWEHTFSPVVMGTAEEEMGRAPPGWYSACQKGRKSAAYARHFRQPGCSSSCTGKRRPSYSPMCLNLCSPQSPEASLS